MSMAQVTVVANQVEKERRGYQAISLTNFALTTEPQISAGSVVEIGDALFEAAANESITGWAGIAVSSDVYIKLAVSGAAATATFTTTAPTWSLTKQGWYNVAETERYIGGLYKDSGGNYTKKWLYRASSGGVQAFKEYGDATIGSVSVDGIITAGGGVVAGTGNATRLKKIIDIGDWNMNTTAEVTIAHGLDYTKIRSVKIAIRRDANDRYYDLWVAGYTSYWNSTVIYLKRNAGGPFESTDFDATSFNRGWITIEYIP